MVWKFGAPVLAFIVAAIGFAGAQVFSDTSISAPPPASVHLGSVDLNGGMHARVEGWNWFYNNVRDRYAFGETLLTLGFSQQHAHFSWRIDFAQPTLIGLPNDAVMNGTPLGLGGTYFTANSGRENAAGFFAKQGFVEIRGLAHNSGTLKLGRFAFIEGIQ